MLKRKRNLPKKPTPKKKGKHEEEECDSCGLPSETWNQIVSGLNLPDLIKCVSLGPADHWLCFFVKHTLKQKQLLGICEALSSVSLPRFLTYASEMEYPVPATNLLKCFSKGCSPKVLPHVIRDVLESCVYLFKINKRHTIGGSGFEIQGMNNHLLNPCKSESPGFLVSVKIMLPDNMASDNQDRYALDDRKFSPKDYTIRIYQHRDTEGDCHPMGELLFSFFKKFKFKVKLFQSTWFKRSGGHVFKFTLVKEYNVN